MFRDMRRDRQQLPAEECEAILRRGKTGILAVNGDDGYPYTVPQNYVYYNGKIYLHGAKSGHKADALRRCNKVSFCVIESDKVVPELYATDYVSVLVFGMAEFIEDAERKFEILDRLAEKYRPDFIDERRKEIEGGINNAAVIEISPEHITGKEGLFLTKKREAGSAGQM